jgi:cell shape-determining protein MreC
VHALGGTWSDTRDAAQLRLEVDRLKQQVAVLEARERVVLLARPSVMPETVSASTAAASDPLLRPALVEARVLGPLAQAWLVERRLVDRGSRAGVQDGALVLAPSRPILDRGRDAELAPDHFVLAGGRVWGRVVRLGQWTSEVRRTTDEGYRDLVTLHSPRNDSQKEPRNGSIAAALAATAPRGILEGSGQPLCRVRLIAADEPVAVGDVVLSASAQGFSDGALVYGEVVRAECPPGANHWDVWVRPALDPDEVPDTVAVLRVEFNPARVASREQ